MYYNGSAEFRPNVPDVHCARTQTPTDVRRVRVHLVFAKGHYRIHLFVSWLRHESERKRCGRAHSRTNILVFGFYLLSTGRCEYGTRVHFNQRPHSYSYSRLPIAIAFDFDAVKR